jgi:hypothetical protein
VNTTKIVSANMMATDPRSSFADAATLIRRTRSDRQTPNADMTHTSHSGQTPCDTNKPPRLIFP